MNNRQRSKQASYSEKYDARAEKHNAADFNRETNDDVEDEVENSRYVVPAKQPARKHNEVKGDAQCQRVRTEPKFHKEKHVKELPECSDEGRVKNFKSLDDIPDYDDVRSNRIGNNKFNNANKWQQNHVTEGSNLISISFS